MDKDNKYYGIIENLVRNHRKFAGLDTIIDDIIDDVYEHSKAIIESINDDNVIDGYLSKVVSTSIITVPKKLNFHNELKHRSITASAAKPIEFVTPKIEELKVQTEKIIPNPVMEEAAETLSDTVYEEEPSVVSEDTDIDIDTEKTENFEPEEETETEELTLTEENLSASEEEFITEGELEQEPEIEKANIEFVDKMINSIAEDTLKENVSAEEEIELPEFEDGLSVDVSQEIDTLFDENTEENDEPDAVTEITESEDIGNLEETEEIAVAEEIEEDGPQDLFGTIEEVSEDAFLDEPIGYSQVSDIENLDDLQVEDEELKEYFGDDEESSLEDNNIIEVEEGLQEDVSEFDKDDFTSESDDGDSVVSLDIVEPDGEFTDEKAEDESFETADILELSEPLVEDDLARGLSEESDFEKPLSEEMDEYPEDALALSENTFADSSDDIGLQEIDTTESFSLDSNVEDTILEADDYSIDLESENDTDSDLISTDDDTGETQITMDYKPVDYSAFNYSPEAVNEDLDKGVIVTKLLELDRQEPELNILKIFDLKYKQNLTIKEIMTELNVEKQDVITALDKMADLI